MRQKKKPPDHRPANTLHADTRKRRNSWDLQIIVPHQVDLALNQAGRDEVAVPAAPNGRSLVNGRL